VARKKREKQTIPDKTEIQVMVCKFEWKNEMIMIYFANILGKEL